MPDRNVNDYLGSCSALLPQASTLVGSCAGKEVQALGHWVQGQSLQGFGGVFKDGL